MHSECQKWYSSASVNFNRTCLRGSASVDIIWVTRCDRDGGEQTTWIKQSLPQRYVWVGVSTKQWPSTQFFFLKGHVRARGSTLWRHRLQEASEFLCTWTPLLEGVEKPKNRQKNLKCSLPRATNFAFSGFGGWRRKKIPAFWNCALRGSIDELIRKNSGPKILRSLFFTYGLFWRVAL